MALNFNDSSNYLHIVSDKVIEGQNTEEMHATFYDVTNYTLDNIFPVGGTTYRGEWWSDGGDLAAPANTRERRVFCLTGKASFTFTGTSISVRLSLNPQWGQAHVLIDGVPPSQIAGVVNPVDIVSCNADDYASWGNESIDRMVADNLAPGQHTIQLLAYNNGAKGYFITSGCKVYNKAKTALVAPKWAVSMNDREQTIALKFQARGGKIANSLSATFGTGLLDPVTKTPLGTKSLGTVDPLTSPIVNCLPAFTGTEVTGSNVMTLALSYLMEDPAGDTPISSQITTLCSSADIQFVGTWDGPWDDVPGGLPELLRGSTTRANWFSFANAGDSVTLRFLQDFGYGLARLYKDPVQILATRFATTTGVNTITFNAGIDISAIQPGMVYVGNRFTNGTTVVSKDGQVLTMSTNATSAQSNGSNANIAFGTYVGSADTNVEPRGYANFTVTGFGAGYNGQVLVHNAGNAASANKGLYFAAATRTIQKMYTSVTDNLTLDFKMKQVPPQPITDVWFENGQVMYTPPDPNGFNLTADEPYDNRGVESIEVDYRFPTFICCYTAGFMEIFKQYDFVITDPGALTRSETQALQNLGIKVYHYVSFGEEDGILDDIYDVNSSQGPHTGDGLGPGGYASYYMKGGYQYGEQSECANDRQRLEGVAACAQNQVANYKVGIGGAAIPGRCSKTCLNDWREGYLVWEQGGPCSAGFTSANNWQRDATTACSNASCPQYLPVHGNCPMYSQAQNVWGQDYSIFTTDWPDENGIWDSYYINAVGRGAGSWFARLRDYYLNMVFGEPVPVEETLTVSQHTFEGTSDTAFVTRLTQAPMDESLAFSLQDITTSYVYTPNTNYSFDKMTGAVTITVEAGTEGVPAPYVGQQIRANYYKRGLAADGVFMDTVDTVDVYPDPVYQQAFADLINDLKLLHPTKDFCSNRGFSIYDKMLHSCALIMTESVFSDYDFNNGTYQLVDEAAAAWNEDVAKMIQDLRRKMLFDVVCLNYAPNDASGDAIRAEVQKKTLEMGWMPWLSTILLNDPLPNNPFDTGEGYIRRNDWRPVRKVIPIIPE